MAKMLSLLIGGYGPEGIRSAEMNLETGEVRLAGPAAASPNASWLVLNRAGDRLYAAEEGGPGHIRAFAREADGTLRQIARVASKGDWPCHLCLSADEAVLAVANYGTGTVAFLPVTTDGLGEATAVFQGDGTGPNSDRQRGPHAHATVLHPKSGRIWTCDLGSDEVHVFRAGDAEREATIEMRPGSGPRHIAFTPDGRFAFVNGELDNTVTAFKVKPHGLTALNTLPALDSEAPAGSSGSEVEVHPKGGHLVAATRGADALSVFEIGADGRITHRQTIKARVKVPRHFCFVEGGARLLAAGQDDGRVACFRWVEGRLEFERVSEIGG
ncbi:MAG: lactonase family protein, partial [Fimbriimonadaceae bacterium]|nr:lactonase family protein [Fimbriimonadaceae bacterium]